MQYRMLQTFWERQKEMVMQQLDVWVLLLLEQVACRPASLLRLPHEPVAQGRTMGHEPRAEPPDDFVYVPCSRSAGLCLDGPLLGTPRTNASLNA